MDEAHCSKQQLALGDAVSEQSGDLVVVGRSSRIPPEAVEDEAYEK
jgi:hypothetical protein